MMKINKDETTGLSDVSEFNKNRQDILEEFESSNLLFRRKFTQAAHWISLDKDLANQYFREEKWFCGWKYKDEIKIINHSADSINGTNLNIGFKK